MTSKNIYDDPIVTHLLGEPQETKSRPRKARRKKSPLEKWTSWLTDPSRDDKDISWAMEFLEEREMKLLHTFENDVRAQLVDTIAHFVEGTAHQQAIATTALKLLDGAWRTKSSLRKHEKEQIRITLTPAFRMQLARLTGKRSKRDLKSSIVKMFRNYEKTENETNKLRQELEVKRGLIETLNQKISDLTVENEQWRLQVELGDQAKKAPASIDAHAISPSPSPLSIPSTQQEPSDPPGASVRIDEEAIPSSASTEDSAQPVSNETGSLPATQSSPLALIISNVLTIKNLMEQLPEIPNGRLEYSPPQAIIQSCRTQSSSLRSLALETLNLNASLPNNTSPDFNNQLVSLLAMIKRAPELIPDTQGVMSLGDRDNWVLWNAITRDRLSKMLLLIDS